jgi:hypothetical protein
VKEGQFDVWCAALSLYCWCAGSWRLGYNQYMEAEHGTAQVVLVGGQ